MKGTIRLSLDPISTLVYVALLILTIYNIRLSWNLAKLKSSVAVKPFESLSSLELNEIEKINHDRRKWSIVGNIFSCSLWYLLLQERSTNWHIS